jgi:NAD(P)H-nitrite reductase large subunit
MPMITNQLQDAPFTEDVRKALETETVCYCSGVTKGDILRAMGQGARTMDDIKAATGACTQGRCRETSPRGR